VTKQLYNLLRHRPIATNDAIMRYDQFVYELRHEFRLPTMIRIIEESGWFDLVLPM